MEDELDVSRRGRFDEGCEGATSSSRGDEAERGRLSVE